MEDMTPQHSVPPSPRPGTSMGAGNTVLAFGPQALSLSSDDIVRLAATTRAHPEWHWILDVLAGLPGFWDTFSAKQPKFDMKNARQQLESLHAWFAQGIAPAADLTNVTNLVLSPLVVVSHIVEYLSLNNHSQASPNGDGANIKTKATLGLCTGILSALAVSLSPGQDTDSPQFREYTAKAIRLAVIVGCVVDSQGDHAATGPSEALAVAWSSPEARTRLEHLLEQNYPRAYTSVAWDNNRTTVTAPANSIAGLERDLRAAGVTCRAIGLRGAFHHPDAYTEDITSISTYCDEHPSHLALPAASALAHPILCTSTAAPLSASSTDDNTPLHTHALRAILTGRSDWASTFRLAVRTWLDGDSDCNITSIGPERCIPPSMTAELSHRVFHSGQQRLQASDHQTHQQRRHEPVKPSDIAIVGMSIKVAGAEDVDEFWQLLCEAKSQHQLVPEHRFRFESPWRDTDPDRKWFGNFVDNHDTFDHKFFKKSAREVASTDPQHRQMLQAAYQAVEQSGYLGRETRDTNIGCFIGSCTADYEHNVACHAPNAFTAVGNLRGFPAGKISHYFGWTGPSLCIDTACSSSLVALHQACQAILSGDCTAALAGGTNIMTHSGWFQNLAAASFLSPTGQCKPFDAQADGYCRGEGVAAVFLKSMSAAIAHGDQIFGTISATAVLQNRNCTPIFVPHTGSLSQLFTTVLDRAQLKPEQIGYAETHGTGTQVGDPVEYHSIREVMGGDKRVGKPVLKIGSAKGLVGHTEGASGAVSLLKSLLMLHHKMIPRQASFHTLNPSIGASPADRLEVAVATKAWDTDGVGPRAILINNYGASGSNASTVVSESPIRLPRHGTGLPDASVSMPFRFFGFDDAALKRYAARFRQFLASHQIQEHHLADLSFNVSRQSNSTLDKILTFTSGSVADLEKKLEVFESGQVKTGNEVRGVSVISQPARRPVILCFGGQVGNYIGIDKAVYHSVAIFRRHLDDCDAICRSLGIESLFPGIFNGPNDPVADVVQLQAMLFSSQYACAQSWVDSENGGDVRVVEAVVGHSFGELTALCVAGVLELKEALRAVIARATVVREQWSGDEKGAMLAVEATRGDVDRLLDEGERSCRARASIACVNGPMSFTLAGSGASIDGVAQVLVSDPAWSSIRSKRLKVTHAFHSTLVEPLVPMLEKIGQSLSFRSPTLTLEIASRSTPSPNSSPANLLPDSDRAESSASMYVANHMRNPVNFNDAVQRLAKKYPAAIWLEAGSGSPITTMVNRALGAPKTSHFQAINITSGNGMQQLTNATLNLWKQGFRHDHWAHHRSQTYEYETLLLPPYQFEHSRHWMELKTPPTQLAAVSSHKESSGVEDKPQGLWTFEKWQDGHKRRARFSLNTGSKAYQDLVAGHVIANTAPICPATVELDIVIEALLSIYQAPPGSSTTSPQIRGVQNQAAICHDPLRQVWLDIDAADEVGTWSWRFSSEQVGSTKSSPTSSSSTLHATGQVAMVSTEEPEYRLMFASYQRLKRHSDCLAILNDLDTAEHIIQGRNIYSTFSPVVDYGAEFHHLQRLVGKGTESAGRLQKKRRSAQMNNHSGEMAPTWFDAHVADGFCQVGGIWVNCMNECDTSKEMYIAVGIERWIRSPGASSTRSSSETGTWDVLASNHVVSDKTVLTDIFVFDSVDGALVEIVLGITYHKVSKASMSRVLLKLSSADSATGMSQQERTSHAPLAKPVNQLEASPTASIIAPIATDTSPGLVEKISGDAKVSEQIRTLLADMSGLESEAIHDDAGLADLGIDSLLGMEVARELGGIFKLSLSFDDMIHITTFGGLVDHMKAVLGVSDDHADKLVILPVDSSNQNQVPDTSHDTSTSAGDSDHPTAATSQTSSLNGEDEGKGGVDDRDEPAGGGELMVPPQLFQETFQDCNRRTDKLIAEHGGAGYSRDVLPDMNKLCVCLAVEAFDEMGCKLSEAIPGQVLERIACISAQQRLCDYLYMVLEKEAGLIDTDASGSVITRTSASVPTETSKTVLDRLRRLCADHDSASRLTYYTGRRLADVLRGRCDGIKLIFGSEEGRDLVAAMYGDFVLNRVANAQMREMLANIISKIPNLAGSGPLRVMELGAGTGGTTKRMVELLAGLDLPVKVKYTFTDLSGSFVAAARKRFKHHPFMDFRVHDIEKEPTSDLVGTQHIIIASNAIHATRSLAQSTRNIRKALRADGGALFMMEMMQPLHWVDMVFGLFEGWWLFEDGREHAIAPELFWESSLGEAGYSHVYWTSGDSPETKLERVLVAVNCSESSSSSTPNRYEHAPSAHDPLLNPKPMLATAADMLSRKATIDGYVAKYTDGFGAPRPRLRASTGAHSGGKACVAITGATGSLGAHIVAHLARLEQVDRVVCLNRRSAAADGLTRQRQALLQRGISLDSRSMAKVRVVEADTKATRLGLSAADYQDLVNSATHIVHNAWPMSSKRPVAGFEVQFQVMRNLIDLASRAAEEKAIVTFQFVSSIATVGHYPFSRGDCDSGACIDPGVVVPEERMEIESVMPNGYGDAKYVCERMLDETLGRHAGHNHGVFRAMSVRPGQIAGSKTSGYWNSQEHLPFLIKSAQTLGAFPDLDGPLCWTAVDDVAGTLCDLVLSPAATYPVYHIDNPVRQPWKAMIKMLVRLLEVDTAIDVVPFDQWLERVRSFPGNSADNPAAQLVDFLRDNFVRMSCGGLLMDTAKSCEHSQTLASVGPVEQESLEKMIAYWKEVGFLR